jgi:hypothetical protein
VRDWTAYVRAHLSLPRLTPEREARIIREVAAQLEDFYRDAIARGATDAGADAFARAQVPDWARMARDVAHADRPHIRPRLDRVADRLETLVATHPQPGALTRTRRRAIVPNVPYIRPGGLFRRVRIWSDVMIRSCKRQCLPVS